MPKTKLTLEEIQVESFATTLGAEQMNQIKGGFRIRGRRYTYRGRWTAVDIRSEYNYSPTPMPGSLDPMTD